MFVDHIRIYAKAGDGGNGCCSFRREKFVPKGGPDGGDGGHGGDVILEVDIHTDNLRNFFYRPKHSAEKGRSGEGRRRTGKSGKNLILKVPPGTMVFLADPPAAPQHDDEEVEWENEFDEDEDEDEEDYLAEESDEVESDEVESDEVESDEVESDEVESDEVDEADIGEEGEVLNQESDDPGIEEAVLSRELIADLVTPGQRIVLRQGGVGGKGNWRFRTDTNQAPRDFTLGTPGEEGWFYFELRKIADVGLVGFPNAGKSTLLRALSNATPKVAAYPFTTLKPMVGVVEFPGFYRTTVADIPGLIEGAHRNRGLGHDFLRHISRCSIFLFVVDTAAVDQRDPISDIEILRTELKLFDEELSHRPWIIVANKIDLEESQLFLEGLKQRFSNQTIVPISAMNGDGIDDLKRLLCETAGHRPE